MNDDQLTEQVADLQAKAAANPAVIPDLAEALLERSRFLDQHDRTNEAFTAAQDGIVALTKTAYDEDHDLTRLMDALVAEYLSAAHRTRLTPDRKLLAPIAVALAHAAEP
jgi:hypothetical protein